MSIHVRDKNRVEAVRGGETIAYATRVGPGGMWQLTFLDHHAPAPHVKVSRRLPENEQRRLVAAILRQA